MIPPGIAGPEVENALVSAADVAASLAFVDIVSAADVAEPEAVFVALVSAAEVAASLAFVDIVSAADVAEPEAVFVAFVSVADIAGPLAFVDIDLSFDILVPVSVVAVEVDSSGHPRFFAFPNAEYYASSSSSDEAAGEESVHSPTGVRTNYGLCNILSNLGLHQNKNVELYYNNSIHGHNSVSDTNHPPTDATTNHSRKTGLQQYQEQRKHYLYQATLPHSEVLRTE